MKSTYSLRALLLGMMPFSNAQFQVLSLILCLLMLGLILKPIFLAPQLLKIKCSRLKRQTALKIALKTDVLIIIYISVTSQRYEIDILRESVILGNDAIFKCSIPSFVSDFVFVENWVDSEANILGATLTDYGKTLLPPF